MVEHAGYIKTGQEQLHYRKYGEGERIIIAFHGYGDDASFFCQLASFVNQDFSLVSFDLPHHSKSKWTKQKLWYRDELNELINNTMKEFKVDSFSLLGYSIGGRVCLSLVDAFVDSIETIVLIASDGLRFNRFYFFLTRTVVGKAIFHSFLNKPNPYMPLIDFARRAKLLDESRYKFAMKYIISHTDRSFLLNVWTTMCRLIPNVAKVKGILKKKNIPVHVYMGRYDKVIPMYLGVEFVNGIGNNAELTVFEKGHRIFDAETLPEIASSFN